MLSPSVLPIRMKQLQCCGIMELHGISQYRGVDQWGQLHTDEYYPKECIGSFVDRFLQGREHANFRATPFILFTQNDPAFNYGEKLATYVEENKLGTVVRSEARMSWTHRWVKLFVWQTDLPALIQWAEANGYSKKLREITKNEFREIVPPKPSATTIGSGNTIVEFIEGAS